MPFYMIKGLFDSRNNKIIPQIYDNGRKSVCETIEGKQYSLSVLAYFPGKAYENVPMELDIRHDNMIEIRGSLNFDARWQEQKCNIIPKIMNQKRESPITISYTYLGPNNTIKEKPCIELSIKHASKLKSILFSLGILTVVVVCFPILLGIVLGLGLRDILAHSLTLLMAVLIFLARHLLVQLLPRKAS
jgi:hypothetical protein